MCAATGFLGIFWYQRIQDWTPTWMIPTFNELGCKQSTENSDIWQFFGANKKNTPKNCQLSLKIHDTQMYTKPKGKKRFWNQCLTQLNWVQQNFPTFFGGVKFGSWWWIFGWWTPKRLGKSSNKTRGPWGPNSKELAPENGWDWKTSNFSEIGGGF